eukprot:CAMPEP_0172682412 /NCGR_PEP_ID=MMETSP1074-20121228/18153_1 /TAXON_ID=2916 /ORGANISM="Ceratium fusus, Strain PA161109" /LENGTH=143 /DNA_ID=CAMNT_0013501093 /DNA_START=283 /DNA_END=715 /DNA_ORIENTATION=-
MPMPVSLEDKADPFLVNGVLDAERAATAQEFQAIAEQIRSEVRVLRSVSRAYPSFLLENPLRLLCLELLRRHGVGIEPWVSGEVAISDLEESLSSEADFPGKEPLVAVRLTEISNVKHNNNYNGGRSMRIRCKQPEQQEACEV